LWRSFSVSSFAASSSAINWTRMSERSRRGMSIFLPVGDSIWIVL
jgi:hypothetical protein